MHHYFTIPLKNMQATRGKTKSYVKDNETTPKIIKPLFYDTVQSPMEMIIMDRFPCLAARHRKLHRTHSNCSINQFRSWSRTNFGSPDGHQGTAKRRRGKTLGIPSFLIWQKRLTSTPLSLFFCGKSIFTPHLLCFGTKDIQWHMRTVMTLKPEQPEDFEKLKSKNQAQCHT